MSAAGMGIGAVAGIFGSAIEAQGQRNIANAEIRAGKEARGFIDEKYELGKLNNLVNQYGGVEGIKRYKATSSKDAQDAIFGHAATAGGFTDANKKEFDQVEREIATLRSSPAGKMGVGTARDRLNARLAELQARRQELLKASGGDPGRKAAVDEAAMSQVGPGILSRYQQEAASADQTGNANLGRYDATTGDLNAQAQGIELGAQRFGQQRVERVKRDSERSLKATNRQATSALLGRGIGAGSAMTDALAGNAEQNQRATNDALGDIEDKQIGLRTGLQTGRLGLMSSRAGGRDAMMLGGQDTSRSLRVGALNAEQNALGGNVMNPWLGQSSSQYFPAASPSGAAMSSFGNSMGRAGSALAGYSFDQYMQQRNQDQVVPAGQSAVRSFDDGGLYDTRS